ncbi:MAG: hypothetical protein ONB44_14570 [candidate division KSB1 bacterium]|nr:hypothetical protein [candidate division KSB1 bacterium]MDZ7303351.1 hypothetical protein [candidate division KSB1 bacterium]MDZ7310399.1 hypothetical protein [candidate division KSB1 bacterium]
MNEPQKRLKSLIAYLAVAICCAASAAWSQEVVGSYVATTPEASLFALNPGYLNPATAQGAIGLITNPAALASVRKTELGFAIGFSHSDRGSFDLQLLDSTKEYEAVNLQSEIEMKERGGLAAFAIGRQVGKFVLGFGFMQPRRAGVRLSASGKTSMQFHFEVNEPITREMVPDLPVASIPMQWQVEAQTDLELFSRPAEIYLSTLPMFFGAAYRWRALSFGVGAKYLHISSSNEVASVTTSLRGTANIVGTPYGVDPITKQPWTGTMRASVQFEDKPFEADYQLGVKGSRWAIMAGSSLDLKLFKLGLTVERGYRDKLEGSYRIRVVHTAGPPVNPDLHDVALDVTKLPRVEGNANLTLRDFEKDSLFFEEAGEVAIGGYTGVAGGLQFLIFGFYAGAEIPRDSPDFGSSYFGGYIDLPALIAPVNIRAGFLQRMDFIYTKEEDVVPLRSVFHLTAGTSIRFGVQRLIPSLHQPVELQVGVRSSIIPAAFNQVKEESEGLEERKLPNLVETLTLGFGLRIAL